MLGIEVWDKEFRKFCVYQLSSKTCLTLDLQKFLKCSLAGSADAYPRHKVTHAVVRTILFCKSSSFQHLHMHMQTPDAGGMEGDESLG
jgi:hypothetical protein